MPTVVEGRPIQVGRGDTIRPNSLALTQGLLLLLLQPILPPPLLLLLLQPAQPSSSLQSIPHKTLPTLLPNDQQ